jgi:hypothetical protein
MQFLISLARWPGLWSGLALAQASAELSLGEGEECLIAELATVGAKRLETVRFRLLVRRGQDTEFPTAIARHHRLCHRTPRGHVVSAPSSGFAAPTLRFGACGVTAP